LNDPLRNPRDPAWQLVGVTISATALIISLFSLPNSTKLTAIIVGFVGFIVCLYIISLSRRVASTTHQGNNVPQQVADPSHDEQAPIELPARIPLQNRRLSSKYSVRMAILSSLAINVVLSFIASFTFVSDFAYPATMLSIVLALAFLGLVVVFIVFCRLVFQPTYMNEISIKPIILFSSVMFLMAIGFQVITGYLFNGLIDFINNSRIAVLFEFSLLIAAESLIILIGTLISAFIRRIKASSKH